MCQAFKQSAKSRSERQNNGTYGYSNNYSSFSEYSGVEVESVSATASVSTQSAGVAQLIQACPSVIGNFQAFLYSV